VRRIDLDELAVVYVGKRQFSDMERSLSPFHLKVEALTAGQIGVKGSLANLQAAIGENTHKVFIFPGIPSVRYSGPEILDIIATVQAPVSLPTSWPPRPDSSSFFGTDDDEDDLSGDEAFESSVCHLM